ncbi:hypothetical protein FB45DRAFT_1034167 [Roridomyces roridus]|uniref:Uncharacterized protein n=1 Tax=Roridomyces roridus TaxID=1738132 RepID=A0AAD7BE00_9AGAR|nr:hypothetical protein FB45DRAFT_1034167 [Roridomyces roridus]
MAVYTCSMPFCRGSNFTDHKTQDAAEKRFWYVVLFQASYTLYSDAELWMDARLRGRDLYIFRRHVHAEEFWARHCISDHRHEERGERGVDRHIPTPPPSPPVTTIDDMYEDDSPKPPKTKSSKRDPRVEIPMSRSASLYEDGSPKPLKTKSDQRDTRLEIPSSRSPSLLTPARPAIQMQTPGSSNSTARATLSPSSPARPGPRTPEASVCQSISSMLPSYYDSSPLASSSTSISTPVASTSSLTSSSTASSQAASLFVMRSPRHTPSIFKGTWQEAAEAAEPGKRVSRLTEEELHDGASFFA